MKLRLRPDLKLDKVNSQYLSHGTVYEVIASYRSLLSIVDDQGDTISVRLHSCAHANAYNAWEIVEE